MAELRSENPQEQVAAYMTILQRVLDTRPSGTRQRIAAALGKNRSFVSQIANPANETPIPAHHVEVLMETCHFSPAQRRDFLPSNEIAHLKRLPTARAPARVRPHTIYLPELKDLELDRKLDLLIGEIALRISGIVIEGSGVVDRSPADKRTGKGKADEEAD